MLGARITLPHFSVSSVMSVLKPADEPPRIMRDLFGRGYVTAEFNHSVPLRSFMIGGATSQPLELSLLTLLNRVASDLGTAQRLITLAKKMPRRDSGGYHAQTIAPTAKDLGSRHA
jgi:hypothetical protein